MTTLESKIKKLKENLGVYDHLAIAFSGGVDSTFLLIIANQVLGKGALAVTAVGPNFAKDEIEYAKNFCENRKIPHLIVNLSEEILESIKENTNLRCYYCKKTIFSTLKEIINSQAMADGSNLDDNLDYRPGKKAIKELGVVSPLEECGFTKEDIRNGLRALNIDIWDKPAYACLASRVPTDEKITLGKLEQIYEGEKYLKELGFRQVRLRHHGNMARIELGEKDMDNILDKNIMIKINEYIKNLGFKHVSLDLGGYKMGSMNLEKVE